MTQQAHHTVEELEAHERALEESRKNPGTSFVGATFPQAPAPAEVTMTPEDVAEIKEDHLVGDANDAKQTEFDDQYQAQVTNNDNDLHSTRTPGETQGTDVGGTE